MKHLLKKLTVLFMMLVLTASTFVPANAAETTGPVISEKEVEDTYEPAPVAPAPEVTLTAEDIRLHAPDDVHVGYTFLTIDNNIGSVNYPVTLQFDIKSGKKWKTFFKKKVNAQKDSTKITGLKPNKKYKARARWIAKTESGDVATPFKTFSFKTGVKEKPQVKSIKVIKKTVETRQTMSREYTITRFTIAITMKKVPKGVLGLIVADAEEPGVGQIIKGKNKVYKWDGIMYQQEQPKISLTWASDKKLGGLSPAVKKSLKIK